MGTIDPEGNERRVHKREDAAKSRKLDLDEKNKPTLKS